MRSPRNLSFLLKIYLIVGTIILVSMAIYYNNTLIRRMQEQSVSTTRLFSRFIAIGLREVKDHDRSGLIREIRSEITIPYIMTDTAGRPMVWNGIDLPQVADDEYARLIDFNPIKPNDELLEAVMRKAQHFDHINDPLLIESENLSLVLHFGPSRLSRELAVAPYIQLAVLVLFFLFGFLGFRAMKIGEQRSIWVGMAKETAHQLGTPLSSIMGWITMLESECGSTSVSDKMQQAVDEISTDIDRLRMISDRFSKIGSMPKLEYQKLDPIIEETVAYFERRRPALRINSTISVEMEELPLIRCSKELLGWVFENLIKNALDAIADMEGRINISGKMDQGKNSVVITFSDNGKGMSSKIRNQIFSPGFTTKSRGWGLGLTLVKRIVEEYHKGSIRVTQTQPNRGTTFQIEFPVG